MLVGTALLAYGLLVALASVRGNRWRESTIKAAVAWGALATIMVELLSLPNLLTPSLLAAVWLGVDLVLVFVIARYVLVKRALPKREDLRLSIKHLGIANAGLITGVVAIIGLVGFVAIASAPNTWDAMTYHLPRVVHWLNNNSVAFYPTYITRQIHMPPGAEYLMLQMYALAGNDYLVSSVQWFSFVGCIIGVSLLARSLGAGTRGQVLAAVVCATISQGILYASAAKNDYVLAFWLVALLYFLFEYSTAPTMARAAWIGGALGLAVLTKGTALVFAGPLILVWWLLQRGRVRWTIFRHLALIVTMALLLNAGQFIRSTQLYGSPLGTEAESANTVYKYSNDSLSPSSLFSNLLRNLALHLGTPNPEFNATLQTTIESAIRTVGGDPNDPRTTWSSSTFGITASALNDTTAGNPLHVALTGLTLILLVYYHGISRNTIILAGGLLLAFISFCLVFKWQPFHVRLHLPLFVLGAAVIAITLEHAWPPSATTSLAAFLLIAALPFLFANQSRPIVSSTGKSILSTDRTTQYFAENNAIMADYLGAAAYAQAQSCNDIGLDVGSDTYEYPLLALLHADQRNIVNTEVKNESARYATPGVEPCLVICVACAQTPWREQPYLEAGRSPEVMGNIILFGPVASTASKPAQCLMSFSSGWFPSERYEDGWLRWTSGQGQISVNVGADTVGILSGEIDSIQRPNDVDVLLNGQSVTRFKTDWSEWALKPFTPLTLTLKTGPNTIALISHNPPITPTNDTRALAIAIKDLQLATDNHQLCKIQP